MGKTHEPVKCPKGHRLNLGFWGKECPICKAEEKKGRRRKKRMSREEYYLKVLEAVRKRSTCDRGESGAIIIREGRIIATGYVGAPAGMPHCDEVGHLLEERKFINPDPMEKRPVSLHCIRTIHAEFNAILQAAYFGVSVRGAIMYCTMTPCYECAKAIRNVGITAVIAVHPYQTQERTMNLFKDCGIPLTILNPEEELY